MEVIATTNAPKALGPYSQAVLAGSILFVSGQIAINPETGEMVQSSIEAETQQVLDNIEAILTEARFRFMDVVKTTIFVDDIKNFDAINAVYAKTFKIEPPAPKIESRRLRNIGPKSVNAPTPIKMTGGKKPVLINI